MPAFVLLLACQDHVDADAGQPSVDEDLRPQNPQFGHHVPQRSAHRPDPDEGVDAAAAAKGVEGVEVNYIYGGQFFGDADITAVMDTWYQSGTEVVFACGGGIYTSAVEAALKNNGYVIGVDVDQNYIGANGVADGTYAYNPFITSAMKGLSEAVNTALADIDAGSWDDIAGSNGNFGLEDGDYIGLPTDADSWNFESFTTDEYEEVKGKIKSGEITVDNSSDDATKPTVSEFTTVNYIQ